ncbi:Hypothetical protein CINCED_3A017072 [Cinara cedri]|uniref:Uncharacterized protein n=1 Tax=Cinara cedri TaxID=506608 RepID=A0A5E4MGN2_9HEMI|nr:Hypothetical protein CINCED_3A017072 [Cinara cedri]
MNELVVSLLFTVTVAAAETAHAVSTTTTATLNNLAAGRVELAIQDLYADLKTMDIATRAAKGKAATPAIRLDDALSTKARYVAESLQSLASGGTGAADGKPATKAAAVADDAIEGKTRRKQVNDADAQTGSLVDRLMNKCVEIALANKVDADGGGSRAAKASGNAKTAGGNVKAVDNGKAAEKTGGCGAIPAKVDVEAIERIFLDAFHELEKLKKLESSGRSSSTVAAIPKRRQLSSAVPISHSPCHAAGRIFNKFGMFNRQRSSPVVSAIANEKEADYI